MTTPQNEARTLPDMESLPDFEALKMWLDDVAAHGLMPKGTEHGFIKVQDALRSAHQLKAEVAELRGEMRNVWEELQVLSPWSESNDMPWSGEILTGVSFLVQRAESAEQARAALEQENARLCERDEVFERQWTQMCEVELPQKNAQIAALEQRCAELERTNDDLTLQVGRLQGHKASGDERIATLEHDLAQVDALRKEIEILRLYGNKDCTAMADAAIAPLVAEISAASPEVPPAK